MGFDYLRDNMVIYKEAHGAARPSLCHRGRSGLYPHRRGAHAADHLRPRATSPPICMKRRIALSAPCKREKSRSRTAGRRTRSLTKSWRRCARITSSTRKRKPATLSEAGVRKAERWFGVENLSDMANNELLHHINAALRAHALMKRDVDYVVQERRGRHRR